MRFFALGAFLSTPHQLAGMTVIVPLGRTLYNQTIPQSSSLLTRLISAKSQRCTPYVVLKSYSTYRTRPEFWSRAFDKQGVRSYATTTATTRKSRPKGHTGRAAAKTPSTKSRSTTAAKKKTTSKAGASRKAKPKPKPKPKPKSRKRVTRPLSKTAINRARVDKTKDLRQRALLNEPKRLPDNAWRLYFSRHQKGIANITEGQQRTRESAQNYKQLSPEEREELNHTANQNKSKNDVEYKKWLSSYSPIKIKEANNARRQLNAEKKVKEGKKKASIAMIKDERLVKHPVTSYALFTRDRHASGDFKHMKLSESARLIGREWRALSASEKKPYEDQSKAESNRYMEEASTVYGKPPATSKTN